MTVGWPLGTFGNLKLGIFSTNVPCPPLPPYVFGGAVTGVMTPVTVSSEHTGGRGGNFPKILK